MAVTAFEVRAMSGVDRQLADLDSAVAERVRGKILWMAAHAADIRHLPLSADLGGLCKRRVGDYRIIYQVLVDRRILLIHRVGHRREIYQ
jgi:mRNA interferase RelE/StbE